LIESCNQRADFVILNRAKRLSGRILWMMFSPDSTLTHPRVAYAIGRSRGTAVQRNRLRRRVHAVLRESERAIPKGRYLIGALVPAVSANFPQVRDDVLQLLKKIEK
jgi:ribonuclease P protein component|tara:strand:- start:2747 stop:3067 length:321 start_codon:yes stop_codon:yes gene_type:complete